MRQFLPAALIGSCFAALGCAAPPPLLFSVDPASGPEQGGTAVILEGQEFLNGMEVWFGEQPAPMVEVLGPTVIRATSPPGRGIVDVRVGVEPQVSVIEAAFQYLPAPVVTAIAPDEGFVEGGTGVRVQGMGFSDRARVTVGGRDLSDLVFIDSETLMGRTPPGPPGPADVVVTNPDGQRGTLPEGYTYLADRCRVVEVSPAFDERDVSVTTNIVVRWDTDVDPASVRVSVRALGDDADLPLDVDVTGRTATAVPRATLQFWGDYTVDVAPAIAAAGTTCVGESSVFSVVRPTQVPQPVGPAPAGSIAPLGHEHAITSSGGYEGVQVWRVTTDPPTLVGQLRLPGVVGAVSTTDEGDRGYVAMGYGGVAILDVSDPAAPLHLATARTPGFAWHAVPRVGTESILLFVADGLEGVRVLDVTDPEGFFEVSAIDPSGARDNDALALDLVGDRLAIANGNRGYALVDVTLPESPTILGVGYYSPRRVVDVALEPTSGVLYAAQSRGGVLLLDTGDASLPLLERVPVDLSAVHEAFDALELDGSTLLVAANRTGVIAFEVHSAGWLAGRDAPIPTRTRVTNIRARGGRWLISDLDSMGVFDAEAGWLSAPASSLGDVAELAVAGDHLYAAANLSGIQVYDTSSAEAPVLVARAATPAVESADVASSNVAAAGPDRVIVGDGRLGIAVFDVVDPTRPRLEGSDPTSDRSRGLVVRDAYVFLCDDNVGLTVFDISNPEAPTVLSREFFPAEAGDQCYAIAVRDDLVFLGTRRGLTVIDVAAPAAPRTAGRFELRADDQITALSVWDSYLVMTTRRADYTGRGGVRFRVQVFDVSDPSAPRRTFVSDDLEEAGAPLVLREVLFVASGSLGVRVFDIANLEAPRELGFIRMEGVVTHLATNGEALYAAQRGGGLGVIHTGALPVR